MIVNLIQIRCDTCQANAEPAESIRAAKAAARQVGFVHVNGKARCADCTHAAVRRALAAGERA